MQIRGPQRVICARWGGDLDFEIWESTTPEWPVARPNPSAGKTRAEC
jgi:hypothetical protein